MQRNIETMKSVLILLSTYNGEAFLCEQLNSLYAQQNVNIHILVRDDGSSDKTCLLLEEFSRERGNMTIIKGVNKGAALSFFELMRYAAENIKPHDYYAFCDQDDIWDDNKLFCAVQYLEKDNSENRLYCCNFRVIDKSGKIILCDDSQYFDNINFKTVMFRNSCLGCSMVFSNALLYKSLGIFKYIESPEYQKDYLALHDVWMIELACLLDSYVYLDSEKHFSYRQHGGNVTTYSESSYINRIKGVIKRFRETPNYFSIWAKIVKSILNNKLSEEKRFFLDSLINYRKSWFNTIKLAMDYSFVFKERYIQIYALISIMLRKF